MGQRSPSVPPPPPAWGWEAPRPVRRRHLLPGAVIGAALLGLLLLVLALSEFGAVGVGWSLVLATLPAPLLVAFVLAIDRYEPEPPRLMVVAFAWGATAAVGIAALLNAVGLAAGVVAFGPEVGELFTAVIVAPFVEEAAKGGALAIIWWRHRHEWNGVIDGIVYAALAGMGFAVVEDLFYYGEAWLTGGETFAATVVVRGVLSPFGHSLFSALLGIGAALSLEASRFRALPVLLGYAAAVFAHAAWNFTALVGLLPIAYLLFFVPLFLLVLGASRMAMHHEANLLRRHLQPEVRARLLHPAALESLASLRGRRELLRRATQVGGRAGRDEVTGVLNAAAETAFARHRLTRRSRMSPDAIERERELSAALHARLRGGSRRQPGSRP